MSRESSGIKTRLDYNFPRIETNAWSSNVFIRRQFHGRRFLMAWTNSDKSGRSVCPWWNNCSEFGLDRRKWTQLGHYIHWAQSFYIETVAICAKGKYVCGMGSICASCWLECVHNHSDALSRADCFVRRFVRDRRYPCNCRYDNAGIRLSLSNDSRSPRSP